MNIYVGNLSFDVTSSDLIKSFEAFGKVISARVVRDRYSGESKGFGFVEMPDKDEAQKAIEDLNEKELKGKAMRVSQARPRRSHRPGGNRGRGGGGFRRY